MWTEYSQGKYSGAGNSGLKHGSKLPGGDGSPRFPEVWGISGADTRNARNCRSRPGPVPWLKHFLLFSYFIIKITLNGRNQTWFVRQHRSSSQLSSRWFQKTVVFSAKRSLFKYWGGEMSQTENTVTSSSGAKRAYRKGNPLSDAEKQRLSVARKRASFKEVKVFLEPKYKAMLM